MKKIKKNQYTIIVENFSEPITYDGSQLANRYTTEKYGVFGETILIFRGGMKLSPEEMVDIKDIVRESHLNKILISSDDSLHFIIEEFDIQPPNMELEYYRLQVLAQIVIEVLKNEGIELIRKGTDMYVGDRKLNVAIASTGVSSSKIHLGINIAGTGFPSHVNAIGLLELGIEQKDVKNIAMEIAERYSNEISKIKEDVSKTRPI
ncbi:MAG: DUF366 family protein [Candidatus Heimdallarchaeota archaeon]|nr:DUF366 family protein [Candidatus Heimdallarchaeota archaeon]